MKSDLKYVIITPVRDEDNYIEKTIQSVISQTIIPAEWIIVNDGSTDKTGSIIDNYAQKYPWIKTIHRDNRGFRKPGGGVIEAFYDAYDLLSTEDWDFIIKLDGDLSFDNDYFEKCFEKFEKNSQLGLASGLVCKLTRNGVEIDSTGDPPFHVRGASKIYRRACWRQISPLVKAPGWDTIDEVKANMHGWKTQTFKGLQIIQHKPTGHADGHWRNWFKNGFANYVTGYHPLFMLGKCIKRATHKPLLVASAGLLSGYLAGYIRRDSKLKETNAVRYLQKQQLRHMFFLKSIYG